jgi:hypothetical protein
MKCLLCEDTGWVCEAHTFLPFCHDEGCPGPGQPCKCSPLPLPRQLFAKIFLTDIPETADDWSPPDR